MVAQPTCLAALVPTVVRYRRRTAASRLFSATITALLAFEVAQAASSASRKPKAKPADDGGWREKRNEDGKVVQELKIEAPSMTEEDQYGYVMPDRYKCDACRAVMFHLDRDLKKKHPKNRRMKQWEYTDAFDDICRTSFEGYGIKLLNGENTLSGPGLRDNEDQLAPGSGAIQMGGESWTKRLAEICRKIVYEKVGEDEIYERFYRAFAETGSGDDFPGLGKELCYEDTLKDCLKGPRPPPKAQEEKSKPEPPKKKEKKSKPPKKLAAEAAKSKDAAAPAGAAPPKSEATAASSGETLDMQTFFRSLAVRHGLTSDEYLAARKAADWEKLVVAMAGRIFNQFAETGSTESCPAGR